MSHSDVTMFYADTLMSPVLLQVITCSAAALLLAIITLFIIISYIIWSNETPLVNNYLLLNLNVTIFVKASVVLATMTMLCLIINGQYGDDVINSLSLTTSFHEMSVILSVMAMALMFVEQYWFICRAIHYNHR